MYTSIHLLPGINKGGKYRTRWDDPQGQKDFKYIEKLIKEGGGEDFLENDVDNGKISIIENMWDLKGIRLINLDIDFPHHDNFEGIDFSYAMFSHCKLNNATFPETTFRFARFYSCTFNKCLFGFAEFYGCTFENCQFVDCDFVERDRFINCDMQNTTFTNLFTVETLFEDCRFDERVAVKDILPNPNGTFKVSLDLKDLASVQYGIKDAYRNGRVISKYRKYHYLENQSLRKYNSSSVINRLFRALNELLTGYGVKPQRVLMWMVGTFSLYSFIFALHYDLRQGVLLSGGAFFTFGANTSMLATTHVMYLALYITEAFLGISLTALLITMLASYWLKDI